MTIPRDLLPYYAFLVGLAIWVATVSFLRRPFIGDSGDDGQYLVSARSLCDGDGYRLPSRPGDPVATKYPIGTSAMTALVMALMPGKASAQHDWLAGRVVVIGCGVGLAVAGRKLLRLSGLAEWLSTLLALALIWHPQMTHLVATLMSDVPFAFITTVLFVRWIQRSRSGHVPDRVWLFDGLLAGAGWLIRGNGITLVAAALLGALGRESGRLRASAAVLVGVACLWLPATIHVRSMGGPRDTGNYVTELEAAYRVADHIWSLPLANVSRIPSTLVTAIFPPASWTRPVSFALSQWTILRWMIQAAALWLITLGIVRLIRSKVWPPQVWVNATLTLSIFIVWHYPLDNRFTLPLSLLALAACAAGVEAVTRPKYGAVAFGAYLFAISILIVFGIVLRSYPRAGVMGEQQAFSLSSLFEATTSNTPPDAVIFCRQPELVHLNTGRLAAPLIDDANLFDRKPASWESLQKWIKLAGDRPLYILNVVFKDDNEDKSIVALSQTEKFKLTPIATRPAGTLWRVEQDKETTR